MKFFDGFQKWIVEAQINTHTHDMYIYMPCVFFGVNTYANRYSWTIYDKHTNHMYRYMSPNKKTQRNKITGIYITTKTPSFLWFGSQQCNSEGVWRWGLRGCEMGSSDIQAPAKTREVAFFHWNTHILWFFWLWLVSFPVWNLKVVWAYFIFIFFWGGSNL